MNKFVGEFTAAKLTCPFLRSTISTSRASCQSREKGPSVVLTKGWKQDRRSTWEALWHKTDPPGTYEGVTYHRCRSNVRSEAQEHHKNVWRPLQDQIINPMSNLVVTFQKKFVKFGPRAQVFPIPINGKHNNQTRRLEKLLPLCLRIGRGPSSRFSLYCS